MRGDLYRYMGKKLSHTRGYGVLGRFAVLAEFRRDAEGFLEAVAPGPSLDPSRGVNLRGSVVQLGLTEDEIDDVWERIADLIERVDAGEIAVF